MSNPLLNLQHPNFQAAVDAGRIIKRDDGTYTEAQNGSSVANGPASVSNVSNEFGEEVAGIIFRTAVALDTLTASSGGCN